MASRSKIEFFRSLPAIRERCSSVFALGEKGELDFWELDLSQQDAIVDFVCELIARDYGTDYSKIPPHGRARHVVGDRMSPLVAQWEKAEVDPLDQARRLLDFMVVSVLLDAGAGNVWKFQPKDGAAAINRSEGLAVASLEMFEAGLFSSDATQPHRVDAAGLSRVSESQIAAAMQVTEANPMDGIEGRAGLLVRLGSVLSESKNAPYFSRNGECRPGNLLDYLLAHPSTKPIPSPNSAPVAVEMDALWEVVMKGFSDVWPADRTKFEGVALGDVWPVDCLQKRAKEAGDELVPFHKLSQWLTYSLIEVMETSLGWKFPGKENMTGLPEYRNGGLLVDFGLLKPRIPDLMKSFSLDVPASGELPSLLQLPPFHASHSAIVEFRAVTIIMLDRIAQGIRQKVGFELSLPQVLEAGTWKAGREIAKKLRPDTSGPPFGIVTDGTVF